MSPDTPRSPLLTVENLVKRFGGFRALDGLSFDLKSGEILGLVGPNGSGKTTCINVVSGLYAPDGGRVWLEDRSIGGLASHRLVHLGINRTFQVPKPFQTLTVRENVEVANTYGRNPEGWVDVDDLLASLDLKPLAERLKELARNGIALLVVEHLMGFIDQITDRVIVMNAGKEIFEGIMAAAVYDKRVVEVFLGNGDAS